MIPRTLFARLLLLIAAVMLVLAAGLPIVSAEAGLLPTAVGTRPGGSLAATAASLATRAAGPVATAVAASTKVAGTSAAAATRVAAVKITLTPPANVDPDEAAAAIAGYASSVLGVDVTVKKAGGVTGEVTRSLSQTSAGSKAQASAVRLAGVSYGAVLNGGAASLSYGSGQLTGDVTVDVQSGALGVYSMAAAYNGRLDADSALALAKTTFPGVANFSYSKHSVSSGYAWYASGTVTGYDLKTKQFVTMAQAVILYVAPGASGKAVVTATVGRGEFAASVKP